MYKVKKFFGSFYGEGLKMISWRIWIGQIYQSQNV